ncbi:hypothetical protein HSBAA_18360 [Vreelandella sulfidaeris]|uniref:Uncharacterized protein n=1 Tax=Vreelandella sulfidaeris TaxID=115553 RepID=A0A455U375_9GAMM|nr:hypothetical protein HSBAA_18360 [Halomonas sulfidaeris]
MAAYLTETPQTDEEAKRSERLMATVDKLNRELGKGAVQLGLPVKAMPGRCVVSDAHRDTLPSGTS